MIHAPGSHLGYLTAKRSLGLSSKSARTHLRGRKTDADDALFIARTVRDGDFIPLQPGNLDTEQLKLVCRQRRFITRELANAKRRLTGLIDLGFPEFSRHFENNHSKAAHAVLKAAPARPLSPGFPCARIRAFSSAPAAVDSAHRKPKRSESRLAKSERQPEDPALNLLIRTMIARLEFFENQLAQLDLHIQRLLLAPGTPDKDYPWHRFNHRAFDRRRTR